MPTMPIALRLDTEIRSLLREGSRRTPHNRQQLIRMTLRKHLGAVIQEETAATEQRVTTIAPWPKGALAKAYRRADPEWDKTEAAAAAAQGAPSWED